jgi:predicted transposase YdaD
MGASHLPPFEIRIGKHLSGVWHYTSIEVYRLKAAEILALGEQDIVGLLPLVPLTHDGGTVEQIEAAGKVAQEHASSEEEQVSIITLLGILASRRIDRELADALVRRLVMSQDLLESSPLYQKWAEEWLAQGMEKGLERGREEGLTIGVRESVQLVLRARFKALPPEVEQAIARASRAALEDVLTHVSDESLDQLRVRLETAPQQ